MNGEFERALLGMVLRGYRDVPQLGRIVSAGDFEDLRHGHIWTVATQLHSEGQVPNALAVMERMGSAAHKLPGGAVYLTELDAPVGSDAPWLASKVREESIRRQIANLGRRCEQILTDVDASPDELVAKIRAWSDTIGTVKQGELSDVRPALEAVIDIAENGEPDGTPLPWPSLQELIGGFHPGQLVTIGAQSGAGKSLALENIATYTARSEKCWVLFVSLEMSPTEIVQRTMAYTANVEYSKLRKGGLNAADWDRVHDAARVIEETRIKFADQPTQTVATIRAAVSDLAQEAKRKGERLGMVVVDYIQLISTTGSQGASRQQQLGTVSRGLKQLAREFDVTVLTAAQLNRAPGIPTLASLREAADIANDSDIVILLHEDTIEEGNRIIKTGDIAALVPKNRAGAQGSVTLQKFGHYARLHDPGYSNQENR